MKVEKMETLGVNVKDARKAAAFFADLFELDFGEFEFGGGTPAKSNYAENDQSRLGSQGVTVTMDRRGFFEFLETATSEQDQCMRNIHFKVADIEAAKLEMADRGHQMLAETEIGGVQEVVYNPAELFGIRLCLVQYDGPSLIDAVLRGGNGAAIPG